MGQRTIDTVLRLQSESEYKAGLKSCSAELRVLKSDLERVTSEFRTNANSMEALTKKGAALSRIYDTQQEKVALLRGALEKAQQTQAQERQTVADLQAQYSQAKKVLSDYGDEVDKNSEEYQQSKAAVDQLRDSIIQHQAKLDSSTGAVSKYAVQLNRAEVELNRMGDQVAENDRLLEEAKSSVNGCAASIDRYGDTVQQAGQDTEKTTSAVEALAGALVSGGLQQAVEDVAADMKEASEASQDYEHTIKQVTTIADESVMSQKELSEGILQVSTDVHRHAEEVSDAAYEALSAGVKTKDVLDFTTQSAQLATAGFTDLTTSVDVLTTVQNAYKIGAEHTEEIASKLVKTQDLGKITVDELGKVIGRVIPSAAAYGVNLDNVATAYANMTAAGINAENTTTYLSTMLDELADSGSGVAEILQEQTGKSFSELMQDGHSLGDVLAILGESVENDNVAFSNLWASSTAAKSAVALFDGSAASFNKTLDDISTSSGTVAKNYEKMADASVTSSKRFEVAQKNLQIVVGDQLNPVLDDLRESGADILEHATQAVQDNPALVSVITGTGVAVGILATGLSALMVAKSVAAAMNALNIALAANPATAVAVGISTLIGVLAGYATQSAATRAEMDQLTASSQELNQTVTDSEEAYGQAMADADAAANTVHTYIERLKELEKQGLTTKQAQTEYATIVEKINHLMPGLNAELDAQTGLLKDGADALKVQADAWVKNAKQQAVYTRYKEDIAAMADAEYELAKNEAMLSMVSEDLAKANSRKAAVQQEINKVTAEYQKISSDASLSSEDFAHKQAELDEKSKSLGLELHDLNATIVKNEEEQKILQEAVNTSSDAVSANKEYVDAASNAYKALADQTEIAANRGSSSVTGLADNTASASQSMQEAYSEASTSAYESINNQIGLFDDLSGKCEMSTQEMIENLLSQQTAFNNYADNIQLALERGIDIGLVQKLSDGSASSIQILAELVTATDGQIAELNAAFAGTEEAKTNVSDAMAGVSEVVLEALRQLGVDVDAESYKLGTNIPKGAARGVEAETPTYTAAVRHMANKGHGEYKMVNAINSPSKRYRQLARYDVEGLIVQYREDTPKVQAATRNLAEQGYIASIRARQAAFSKASGSVDRPYLSENLSHDSEGRDLLRKILDAVLAGKKLVLDTGAIVGATAPAYDQELGARQVLAARGAI